MQLFALFALIFPDLFWNCLPCVSVSCSTSYPCVCFPPMSFAAPAPINFPFSHLPLPSLCIESLFPSLFVGSSVLCLRLVPTVFLCACYLPKVTAVCSCLFSSSTDLPISLLILTIIVSFLTYLPLYVPVSAVTKKTKYKPKTKAQYYKMCGSNDQNLHTSSNKTMGISGSIT